MRAVVATQTSPGGGHPSTCKVRRIGPSGDGTRDGLSIPYSRMQIMASPVMHDTSYRTILQVYLLLLCHRCIRIRKGHHRLESTYWFAYHPTRSRQSLWYRRANNWCVPCKIDVQCGYKEITWRLCHQFEESEGHECTQLVQRGVKVRTHDAP